MPSYPTVFVSGLITTVQHVRIGPGAVHTAHMKEQTENLETIEQLSVINGQNNTALAMAYGIIGLLEKLKEIHQWLCETNDRIRPWETQKGAEA